MIFRIEVSLPEPALQLTPQSRVMCVGSCFAQHMGERISECLPKQQVLTNPTGVLYNPLSICSALDIAARSSFQMPDALAFEGSDGLWHHWWCSTLFTAVSRDSLMEQLYAQWQQAHSLLGVANVLFVTLSTDVVYALSNEDAASIVVANCHKQPARMFCRKVANLNEMKRSWEHLIDQLLIFNPNLHLVFTLSPYRYTKDGLHASALSKARLLLLIDHLCNTCKGTFYFPAYEIITDELRDYRFYEPDMLHPSEQAIDYVWEKLQQWTFSPELTEYAHERKQIVRDMAHRPLHPDSEAYKLFVAKREKRVQLFEKKWGTKF